MVSLRWLLACFVLSVGMVACTADRGGIAPPGTGGAGGDSGMGGTGGDAGLTCPEMPCENGGNCLDNICDCTGAGYAGDFCEIDIDECLNSETCINGGACTNDVGSFTCDCSSIDFDGDNCENMIDDCAGIDCTNGACIDGNREYACDCDDGWANEGGVSTGTCNVEIKDCMTPGVCVNGDCNDSGPSVVCTCDAGWKGTACNIAEDCGTPPNAPDDATSTVNGTGYNETTDYVCNPGYSGGSEVLTCGDDENWSPAAPTLTCTIRDCMGLAAPTNGSVDMSGGTTFGETATYSCDSGYSLSGSTTRMCDATGSWSGSAPTCEEIADCLPNPCLNGGSCTEDPGSGNYTCNCVSGYDGDNCENDIDECMGGLGPCDANGTSTCDGASPAGSYTCACNAGYSGMDCDGCAATYVSSMVTMGTCVDDPCDPDPGTCVASSVCFQDTDDTASCTETCDDMITNQDESDQDCGGMCGANCADGADCGDDADCATAVCNFTTGLCGQIADGETCSRDGECISDTCGVIVPRKCISCSDSIQNGDETGIDCGGATCPPC